MPDLARHMRLAGMLVIGVMMLAGWRCPGDSGPILIGAAGRFDDQRSARDNLRGMQLAIEGANATGGVRGRKLQTVVRSDMTSGELAAHIAAEFLANKEISVVVGHSSSTAMLGAAPVYDGGLPAIATTASSPALSGISPWVFRVISSDSATGAALARFASSRAWRTAAVLYQNDVYGRGLADAFRRHYAGTVVATDPIVDTVSGFMPYARHYARIEPDVVVIISGRGSTAIAVQRDLGRAGVRAAILASEGATDLSHAPATAEDVYVVAPFSGMETRPAAREFIERFRARFNDVPDHNAALAYDATTMAIAALRAVGPDRRRIREYLATRDESQAMPGVSGPVYFNQQGDRADAGAIVLRVNGGRVSVVAEQP